MPSKSQPQPIPQSEPQPDVQSDQSVPPDPMPATPEPPPQPEQPETPAPEPAPQPEPTEPDPDRVVDPPVAEPGEATDVERPTSEGWVRIDSSATLTLPSGASYAFNAGDIMQLSADDANYVIDQGYGTKADDPSGE